jgi:predicted DNA-binding protein (MmcQ/YjbR family)
VNSFNQTGSVVREEAYRLPRSARQYDSRTARKPSKPRAARPSRTSSLRDFCRALPATTEDVKWGDDLVFSVGGKMYAAFDLDNEVEYGFKCDDDDFDRLTAMPGIIPAPYAARFGWVAIRKKGALTPTEARALLKKSYGLVMAGLPRKVRLALTADGGDWSETAGKEPAPQAKAPARSRRM